MGTIKLFLLLISTVFIYSCKKEINELNNFDVTIHNNYFELLDTVSFANKQFVGLDIGKSTNVINITNGTYPLHCVTNSKLAIDASIEIKGSFQNVKIVINSNGAITIQ